MANLRRNLKAQTNAGLPDAQLIEERCEFWLDQVESLIRFLPYGTWLEYRQRIDQGLAEIEAYRDSSLELNVSDRIEMTLKMLRNFRPMFDGRRHQQRRNSDAGQPELPLDNLESEIDGISRQQSL